MHDEPVAAADCQALAIRRQRHRERRVIAVRQLRQLHLFAPVLIFERRLIPAGAGDDPILHDLNLPRRELFLGRHVRVGVGRERLEQLAVVRLALGDDRSVVTAVQQTFTRRENQPAFLFVLVVTREAIVPQQPHGARGGGGGGLRAVRGAADADPDQCQHAEKNRG